MLPGDRIPRGVIHMNMKPFRSRRGQAMTEYIIIVVVVALAALFIFAVFSDTIREKLGGGVELLGGDSGEKDDALDQSSLETLQELDEDGLQ
jgi:hypothetical protein